MTHTSKLEANLPITQNDKATPYFEDYLYTNLYSYKLDDDNAVIRTRQSKDEERISVLDFIPPNLHASIKAETCTTDLSTYFYNAANSGYYQIFIPAGGYPIGQEVNIPIRVSLIGEGYYSKIYTMSSGTYDNDYIFVANYSFTTGHWISQYPSIPSGGFYNLHFVNVEDTENDASNYIITTGINAIYAAGSYEFENLRGVGMCGIIHTSSEYDDDILINRIKTRRTRYDNSYWQIDVNNLGDGLRIYNISLNHDAGDNGLRITGSLGAHLDSIIIGGLISIKNCTAISIENWHSEDGYIQIDQSSIKIKDSVIWRNTFPVIQATNTTNLYAKNHIALDIVQFVSTITDNWIQPDGADLDEFDILITNGTSLSIKDCYRRLWQHGAVSLSELHGIRIGKSGSLAFDEFNDLSFIYSKRCTIGRGYHVNECPSHQLRGAFVGIDSLATSTNNDWTITSGTYYYDVQMLFDTTRMIGRTGTAGEFSLALTLNGDGPLIKIDYGTYANQGILRFYRGTSTGNYDYYCDVPVFNASFFYDSGYSINGFPWVSRTAGAVDAPFTTLTYLQFKNDIIYGEGTFIYYAARPTVGTWTKGDRLSNNEPPEPNEIGLLCTASGASGGTWDRYGLNSYEVTYNWTPGTIAAGSYATSSTISLTEGYSITWGAYIEVSAPGNTDDMIMRAYVTTGGDSLKITVFNPTGSGFAMPSGNYTIFIRK